MKHTIEEYTMEDGDLILPKLDLPNPCPVAVRVTEDRVTLFVGPREWSWDRQSGELVDAGTFLG